MARSSVPPNGAEHIDPAALSLRLADKLVREGKYAAALENIAKARAHDPKNLYAVAYEERIKSLLNSTPTTLSRTEPTETPFAWGNVPPTQPRPTLRTVGQPHGHGFAPEPGEPLQKRTDAAPGPGDPIVSVPTDQKTAAILKRARRFEREQDYERAFAELARASLRDPENAEIRQAQLRVQRALEERRGLTSEEQKRHEESEDRRRREFLHAQADPTRPQKGAARSAAGGLQTKPRPVTEEKSEEQRRNEEDALREAESVRLRRENEERRARLDEERRQAEAERKRLEEEQQRLRVEQEQQRAEVERLKREQDEKRLRAQDELRRAAAERLAKENEAKRRQEDEAKRRAEAERLWREVEENRRRQEEADRREATARLAREVLGQRLREEEQRKSEATSERREEMERLLREREALRQEQIANLKRELEIKRRREEEEREEEVRYQIEQGLVRARQFLARGHFDEALRALSFGLTADPSDEAVQELASQVREAKDRARREQIEFERREEESERRPREEASQTIRAHLDEADTLAAQNRFKEALRSVARAYALDPVNPEIRSCEMRIVAQMEELRKEHEESRKQREREVELKKEEEFRQLVETQRQRALREMSGASGEVKKKGRARDGTRPYRSPGNGT